MHHPVDAPVGEVALEHLLSTADAALLDGITDPRNFGAIIRSAEVLGAHGVVVEERRGLEELHRRRQRDRALVVVAAGGGTSE